MAEVVHMFYIGLSESKAEENVHAYVLAADHDDCGLVLCGTPMHFGQNLRHRLLHSHTSDVPAAHWPFAAECLITLPCPSYAASG
jgi:hypothetical protein